MGLKELADKITYKIVNLGKPEFQNGWMAIPITALINNQTLEELTIDRVRVWVSYLTNNKFINVGFSDISAFSIIPGSIQKTFVAQADVKPIANDFINTLATILISKKITLKTDVIVTVSGIELPTQTITQDVQL